MFQGKGRPLSEAGVAAGARTLDVDLPSLWAVMTVETKGCGYLADRRPQILFERHVFHRLTSGAYDAVAPDLSNRKAGGYGAAGALQYARLERAIALDRRAALESTSWGLGQIMGFNAEDAGARDVENMVAAMCESEDAQLQAMVALIATHGLDGPLQRGDWAGFAYGYNGQDFQKNNYDGRLALASRRFEVGPLPNLTVRAAQLYLAYLGYSPGGVDGWFGTRTQRALIAYQKAHGILADGLLDSATLTRLQDDVMASQPGYASEAP